MDGAIRTPTSLVMRGLDPRILITVHEKPGSSPGMTRWDHMCRKVFAADA